MVEVKNTAFLFPGQGSQVVGMGKGLYDTFSIARDVFSEADSVLGIPFSKIMWDGPDLELNDTFNTQPALFIHSFAAYKVFQSLSQDTHPLLLAGHSLGQLSAIAAAGGISFADGLRLVRKRGELMKRAGEINPGGMAAILGVDIPTLDKVCVEASSVTEIVQVANDNCPGQVVISGQKSALERALVGAKSAGAKRALPLAVSIAAHSPLMDLIQAEWDDAIRSAIFSDIVIPIVGNVSAGPIYTADGLRGDVSAQMQSRVRWTESVRWMASQGVTTFVEFGPGAVLGGLVKRIVEGPIIISIGSPADFEVKK
ncbi:MAG: ACP S-malonyltransferase [Chloroflexi bacterium]|nr:ACP S-malonyltransferase [Chloroflexota bacterium]